MDELVLTPAECVALINQTLDVAYPTVLIEGEVGSFKVSREKYIFFDIKDAEATLPCFMMAWQLRTELEDGMRVQILAAPRLTRWGKFSLNVRQVMPVGKGSIKRAFELLRAKLEAEGLLDESRKRLLPQLPRRIGVISSVEAAGYADFMKIIHARWGGLEIEVANVQVQGIAAIEQNIAAIAHFNQQAMPVDVLVIIRGGGSPDDLAVYNDEQLARTIAASRIPTLVGVGHEVDTSLADLVADVRAATPSNAAQIVVPDRQELLQRVARNRSQLQREVDQLLIARRQTITHAKRQMSQTLDTAEARGKLNYLRERLAVGQNHALACTRAEVQGLLRTLRQLNPELPLRRGYTLVRNAGGDYVTTGAQVATGDMLEITFADAVVQSEAKTVRPKKEQA
jgi:exodeoxyribonuclease VII large subunit